MELYQEILLRAWMRKELQLMVPNSQMEFEQFVEGECYKALKRIKEILEDDELEDPECFRKIEEIVCVFEALGSDGGNRHDFG